MKLGLLLILTLGLASAQQQPESRPGTYAKKIETSNEEEKILDFINGVGNVAKFVYDSIPKEEKKTTETILHTTKTTDKPIVLKETLPIYIPKKDKVKLEEVKQKIDEIKEISTTTSKEGLEVTVKSVKNPSLSDLISPSSTSRPVKKVNKNNEIGLNKTVTIRPIRNQNRTNLIEMLNKTISYFTSQFDSSTSSEESDYDLPFGHFTFDFDHDQAWESQFDNHFDSLFEGFERPSHGGQIHRLKNGNGNQDGGLFEKSDLISPDHDVKTVTWNMSGSMFNLGDIMSSMLTVFVFSIITFVMVIFSFAFLIPALALLVTPLFFALPLFYSGIEMFQQEMSKF